MPSNAEIHWIDLPSHRDERGRLTAIEAGTDIPIVVERVFYVHETTQDRGGHAHRDTDQVLIAI
ncbi:MAG: WxcM-like domain-containing protein, partial [Pseudonocardiaceae bacterium]